MYRPVYTKQFEKDIERCRRRGKNLEKFKILTRALLAGEPLDPIHRDHRLIGHFIGRRECHMESDWLLVYRIKKDRMYFERTGTHSDLFKK
uniref:mRNA interferase YafQ n=1 Tax=Candidatus Kentrum sp. FM TaxID=2126340 RepID=A0A450TWS4_9GAMM|nr:MAG: mRNA interferase YafQ [Candidatus Kentron sp. FM]VFJ73523.1 MAG: mRNA interferase YafQ [Candidatus Kentron sp. FM]VFK20328.1 MAG: mRNA interferase YafQ [Candidatus Kentron sp. FM]